MAYMNQAKKAVIKANLEKVLKPLGFKFGLRVRNHMSIALTIKSGPVDFIGDYVSVEKAKGQPAPDYITKTGYMSVNKYWYKEHFSPKVAEVIGKTIEALMSADYYDRSDSMVDYFDTAYYMDLDIGSYDKPYEITK